MSKPKNVIISWSTLRLSLDTVCAYYPFFKSEVGGSSKYGITFVLRSGGKQSSSGDDEVSRDKLLAFLDEHFNTQSFKANKCDVCARRDKKAKSGGCTQKPGETCYSYNNYKRFQREGPS